MERVLAVLLAKIGLEGLAGVVVEIDGALDAGLRVLELEPEEALEGLEDAEVVAGLLLADPLHEGDGLFAVDPTVLVPAGTEEEPGGAEGIGLGAHGGRGGGLRVLGGGKETNDK